MGMNACAYADPEKVATLLENGADPNFKSDVGETPLHLSGIKGSAEVVRLLLKAGTDVNARTTGKRSLEMTPMSWMAYSSADQSESIAELIKAGADLNLSVASEEGPRLTCLDIAKKVQNEKVEKLLRESGAKTYAEVKAEL